MHLENPVDAAILMGIQPTLQPLRAAGVTPNMITWASAAAAVASLVCCFAGRPHLAAAAWVAGYVLDCADGFMARRYNMETEWGDRLDHATDVLGYGGLVAFVLNRIWKGARVWPLYVEAVLVAGALYHMQCQEKGSTNIPIKGISGCACMDKSHLRYSRWLGLGTLLVWHIVLIYYYIGGGA